ncbi:hypothetical protein U1Q18_040788 [Sarracenia purpurea var. burkii]
MLFERLKMSAAHALSACVFSGCLISGELELGPAGIFAFARGRGGAVRSTRLRAGEMFSWGLVNLGGNLAAYSRPATVGCGLG